MTGHQGRNWGDSCVAGVKRLFWPVQHSALQANEGSTPVTLRPGFRWWPEILQGLDGEPRFKFGAFDETHVSPKVNIAASSTFESDPLKLLEQFRTISAACESVDEGKCSKVAELQISCLMKSNSHSVWSAQDSECPVAFICSRVEMDSQEPLEAFLWAIYAIEERLTWDRTSFVSYEIIQPARGLPNSSSLADVIHCRMPSPPGVADRDVVQERFLLRPQMGCYAIVMRSPSDQRAAELCRPPTKCAVRARCLISGFMLQERPGGGIVLTSMSQTDLGGSIPQWVQAMAKKACKNKPVEWAQRLRDHCTKRSAEVGLREPPDPEPMTLKADSGMQMLTSSMTGDLRHAPLRTQLYFALAALALAMLIAALKFKVLSGGT